VKRKTRNASNLVSALVIVSLMLLLGGAKVVAAPTHLGGSVNVVSWGSSPTESAAFDKTLKAFQAKTGIQVNFSVNNGDYNTVLKTQMTAGTAPDVFYLNSDHARDFEILGALHSLDYLKKVKSFGFTKFYKSIQSGFVYKGHTYGFAKDYSTLVIWYNKTMFKAAHIKSPPTTWTQFAADAKKLTHKSAGVYGASLPNDIARFLPFVTEGGGAWLNNSQTKSVINSKASKAALNWYAGMYKNGYAVYPGDVGAGWDGEAFGREKVAMTMEGNWMTSYMQATFPSVKWGVAELPRASNGKLSNLNFTAAYAMWAKTPHFAQASALIQFLAGKQGEGIWAHNVGYLPSRTDVKPPSLPNGAAKVYIAQVKVSKGWFFPPGFFDAAATPVNNDIGDAMKGKISVSAALSDMQSKSNAALASVP
jgi:multiple sugar transport system substrate-binding protein